MTLAIQTMRNSMMVGVFIGGGVLNLAVSTANEFNEIDNTDGRMKARTCVLAACCICSFLCWVNVIRYCAHLGYLLGTLGFTPSSPSSPIVAVSAPVATTSATIASNADDHHVCCISVSAAATTTITTPAEVPATISNHKSFVEDVDKQFQFAVLIARYLMISFRYVFSQSILVVQCNQFFIVLDSASSLLPFRSFSFPWVQ